MASITTSQLTALSAEERAALQSAPGITTIIPNTPKPPVQIFTTGGVGYGIYKDDNFNPDSVVVGRLNPTEQGSYVRAGSTYNGLIITNVQVPKPADINQFLGTGQEWAFEDFSLLSPPSAPTTIPTPKTPVGNKPMTPQPSTTYTPAPSTLPRATKVSQMYTITPDTFQHDMLYFVGRTEQVFSKQYTLTNITTNADLIVSIVVPPYVSTNITSALLKPQTQIVINIDFNSDGAIAQLTSTKQSTFNDQLDWTISPTNYTGPVYISKI